MSAKETAVNASIKPLLAAGKGSSIAERMRVTLNYDELTNCMRCGFCQPSCPTFKETGLEAASPRGRIALMKAVVDGLMEPDESFQEQMDLCLGCRACEPVCPADVKYGQLIEQTRDSIEAHRDRRWWAGPLRSAMFKGLFPHPKRMRMLGGALSLYQKSGLRRVARSAGVMRLFPKPIREMEKILPDTSYRGVAERLGVNFAAKRPATARVGMFRGCIMDMMFTETNVNTVKLLSETGFDVVIPDTQTCCGALHAHAGELDQARALARRNIAAFREAGVDYIVSNAGGCGALLVEYQHLLHDDPDHAEDAAWFAERVKDISQLIMEKGDLSPLKAMKQAGAQSPDAGRVTAVTYQDSCHLRNVMRAGNAPRDLLHMTGGITFNELRGADTCCGSAGIYNLMQPAMASGILDHKMEHVQETQAEVLLTSNPGCLLQMKAGIERAGLSGRMKAMHIADFIYEQAFGHSEMS